ncbi:MAG TPA: type II toxin-antitoxin system RelE/ParE family toxin [Patescibacteria group bacterium]|nr:type II toxin-antitoxin system RelE/ParE family toxin [Patescibacteria group bacterium]
MRLTITKKAEKELDKLPNSVAKNISEKILLLSKNPFPTNSKKLSGQDNYRLRVGSYRVIYSLDPKAVTVTILRVADKKTVYR